jgi:hypothetical protein
MDFHSIKVLDYNYDHQCWQYIKDGTKHSYYTNKQLHYIGNKRYNPPVSATWVYCNRVKIHEIVGLYLPLDYDNPIPNLTKFYKLLLLQG